MLFVVATACQRSADVIAPANPPVVSRYEVYPFGTPVDGMDHRVLMSMLDQLEPRFGRVDEDKLRVFRREITADADLASVRAYYAHSAAERNLSPLSIQAQPRAWAMAFTDGDHVWAVQALAPDADPTLKFLPLTIVTNLDNPKPER